MSDLALILTAAASLLVPVGGGLGFVWAKVEKRLAECDARETLMDATIHRLTFEVRRNSMAVNMLSAELMRVDPRSPTLQNVGAILRTKYEPSLSMPDDWTDLLGRIEAAGNVNGMAA